MSNPQAQTPSGSLTVAEQRVATHAASGFAALFDAERGMQKHTRVLDKPTVVSRLNDVGHEAVLEMLAGGDLLSEVALRFDVPLIAFNTWLQKTLSSADVDQATKLGADTLMLKARVALTVSPDSAAEGAMIRAYADHMVKMAERLDPSRWAPQRAPDAPTAPVTINILGGIPGLEALSSKAASPLTLGQREVSTIDVPR